MLDKDPRKRIKIKHVLNHEFLDGFEKVVKPKKKIKLDFKTILSKGLIKLIEKKRLVNIEVKKQNLERD